MSLSDGGEDDFSSDDSPVPAKRPRTNTLGASSTTSFSSVQQESDEDTGNKTARTNENIRLSRSSSTSDDDVRPGFGDHETDSGDDKRPQFGFDHIQDSDTAAKGYNINKSKSEIKQKANKRLRRSSSENSSNDDVQHSFDDADSGDEKKSQLTMDNQYYNDGDGSKTKETIKGEYSDKAQRMMSKMGFRPGQGLGKSGHGRTEPVEASTQKGRRGLGLRPSAVGAVPKDFKWSPDDAKPEVKEEVTWIPTAREPLSGDILEEWMKKGPKKLTVDDEIEFVDAEILKGVLDTKTIFDSLDDGQLRDARFRSNPYETIGSVIFLNRAAVKMANIDSTFDFMFTEPKKPNGENALDKTELLYFADVCAGPGGFSEYVLYRKGWRAKGFGFTLKASNDFKLSDFYAGTSETFNPYYGVEGDGNIFNPANLSSLKDHVLQHTDDQGVHFLMADGGFSVEGQENLQEILSKQLYLCQCLAALMLVRTGGHFVVKLFDVFTPFSVGLIYIMYHCFEQVSIHKPVTSRPANSERYLICKWKRFGTDAAEKHLFSVNSILWTERDRGADVTELVPLHVLQEDRQFYEYIYNSNCVIGVRQIKNLLKIAQFSKDKDLKDESQAEVRQQCIALWRLPNEVRTQPERLNSDDTLARILDVLKPRPPDASSPLSFKHSVLGKPAEFLTTADSLNKFKNVYDWHFMFMDSTRNSPDLKFFIGCGGKQVYQLEGVRWKIAVDLHITIPSKTLIYAEIVKEYEGQGNQQMHRKALHVIDAIMLGGIDVSHLSLSERLSQCALFCTAVHKPFDKQAMPLRCKRLISMEQFPTAVNNLEYRAMKRVKRAVTVTVPSRLNGEQRFHTVSSVLFIKEIKEPWQAQMSKKSGHKYYFGGLGKDRKPLSEYFIPEEARLDMISAFLSRIVWPWEPAVAVLDGSNHEGVTRPQMESYIQHNIKR